MSRQQRAAAALVGSVALIIAASPAASAAAAMSYSGPAVAAPVTVTAAPRAAGPALAGTPTTTEKPVYRVAKGDYLGEVAERYLDDFDRYPEVARLNRLHDADRIRPGQLIKLPAEADDAGARRHAGGHLVTPRKPSPHPPVTSPTGPRAPTGPQATQPPAGEPVGVPPAMAAGASRATDDDGMNRPLAVSAVLAVASIVGAQIGAVLGLRRRPARVTAGRTSAARTIAARTSTARMSVGRSAASRASAARALVSGRHRRD